MQTLQTEEIGTIYTLSKAESEAIIDIGSTATLRRTFVKFPHGGGGTNEWYIQGPRGMVSFERLGEIESLQSCESFLAANAFVQCGTMPPERFEYKKTKIRTRDDGVLEGVSGPVFPCLHDRESIASRMGWNDSGNAVETISNTIKLLREGKAVKLTSHSGVCYFQPLLDSEDGTQIPKSRDTVYNADGQIIERLGAT